MINNKKLSKKREVKAAKDIGGKSHIMSGAGKFNKADLSNKQYIVEDKFTFKEYYNLNIGILNKLEKQARQINKIPILRLGYEKYKKNFAIINYKDCNIPQKEEDEAREIKIIGKSRRLQYWEINDYYLSANNFYICNIFFFTFMKNFVILEWNDFINNQDKFVC